MGDLSMVVPPYYIRGIFIISILVNSLIMGILSFNERNIYKFLSITLFGIVGVGYWYQDTPSRFRNILCNIDKGNCYMCLGIYGYYFEYLIQYILLALAGICYVLEFIITHNWVIYHIAVHLLGFAACISTFHYIL